MNIYALETLLEEGQQPIDLIRALSFIEKLSYQALPPGTVTYPLTPDPNQTVFGHQLKRFARGDALFLELGDGRDFFVPDPYGLLSTIRVYSSLSFRFLDDFWFGWEYLGVVETEGEPTTFGDQTFTSTRHAPKVLVWFGADNFRSAAPWKKVSEEWLHEHLS